MIDSLDGNSRDTGGKQIVADFLRDAARDIDTMRSLTPRLRAGDATAWTRLCALAHNLAAGADVRKLGILAACARELEMLSGEHVPDSVPAAFLMQCVDGAIEAVALEAAQLQGAR